MPCRNRYTHEISFIGRAVIGNVQKLTAIECVAFVVSGGGQADPIIATANEGEALGTATVAQNVTVRGCCCFFQYACFLVA